MTINSTSSGYCTPQEMFIHFDIRLIGMLVSDTGTPITDIFILQNNNVLKSILLQASAEIEAACARGGRYSKEDLEEIYNSNTAAKRFLTWLTASIALYRLWQRRGDPKLIVGDFNTALQYLEALETGKRVFPFVETEQSGRRMEFIGVNNVFQPNDLRFRFVRLLGNTDNVL